MFHLLIDGAEQKVSAVYAMKFTCLRWMCTRVKHGFLEKKTALAESRDDISALNLLDFWCQVLPAQQP